MTNEAAGIRGPLHAEALGPTDAPAMVFVHPNPMDGTSWLFQMAHFSTWYHCIAVDLPGYGRSPSAGPGLTMREIANACWQAVDARDTAADVETIINLLSAHAVPDPDSLQAELRAPVLLVSGSLDNSHQAAFRLRDRLPDVEMVTIEDAGHACHMEQPWAFDRAVISFLRRRGHLQLPDVDAFAAG